MTANKPSPAHHLKRLTHILVAVFVLFVLTYALILTPMGVFDTAKLKTSDIFFRLAHRLKPLPNQIDSIVVVAIDDDSLQTANRKWPWDRDIYADIVKNINSAKPKVIGFDIIFLGESVDKKNDEKFVAAIKNAGNVVLASYYSDSGEKIVPYTPFAAAAKSYGPINKPRDRDYRIRSTRFFMEPRPGQKEGTDFSFEIKVLCQYYGCSPANIEFDGKSVILRRDRGSRPVIKIPVVEKGIAPINFIANLKNFKIIPVWKIIKNEFNKEDLKGKIVLIGQTNEIIHDVYPTPLNDMAGVLVNANSILTALSGRFITIIPQPVNLLIFMIFSALALLISYKFPSLKGLILILFEIIAFMGLSAVLFYGNFVGDFFSVILFVLLIYVAVNFYKYICLIIESATLKQDAITDGLTGLYILRYFSGRLKNEFERAKRYNTKLSLVMMDIDFFKGFNDKYGHEQGNYVLKTFADTMDETFRKSDILVRYGGEEFCALLPGVGRTEAVESAERFRKKLQSLDLQIGSETVYVTVSLGVVSFPDTQINNSEEFIEFADRALYDAKNSGRNRTAYYKG